jgi:hypothetical protein
MSDEFDVVDEVTRETAAMLAETDATLAYRADGDTVFVLEARDE